MTKGSYFDLIDVDIRSKALVLACKKLVVQAAHDLADCIVQERKRLGELQEFWQSFRYKPFFGTFSEILGNTIALLAGAEKQLDRNIHLRELPVGAQIKKRMPILHRNKG